MKEEKISFFTLYKYYHTNNIFFNLTPGKKY